MCPPLSRRASIGILSTYPPTQCGLATFTAALLPELSAARVVRVVEDMELRPAPEVVAQVAVDDPAGDEAAAARLNTFDVAVIQHEYGIYGGPDGRSVLDIARRVTVPLVVVFHTVLVEPTLRQRRILERLLELCDIGIVMTQTARGRLVDLYGADPAKVLVIPHGAVDHGRSHDPTPASTRPTILTWGLLGPGKGIEWALRALPELADLDVRYLVVGQTHPKVLARSGEGYRKGLRRLVTDLGLDRAVEFDASYLGVGELARLVESVDVVLLPYDSREQVTSGVLIEAVAAGRPVIATAFPHAIELLGDGTGLVVPAQDPGAIAAALRSVISQPDVAADMAQRARTLAPELTWTAIGRRYQEVADTLLADSALGVSA